MPDAPASEEPVLDPDLGARVADGGVTFTVWAPRHRSLVLVLEDTGEQEMEPLRDGYFRLHVPGVGAGQRYWFRLPEGRRADPASRFQPEGVSGPSMIVDSSFAWTDGAWTGAVPTHRHVIYEMHLGTFTRDGTWAAAQERLPDLAALGITTIEVMPIAEFSGRFGWGYDGVFLFAPYHRYGTPDDVRQFVDAAHASGLAVILDVVYNHIGPVGSVLTDFSDHYFSDYESEWGRGFNLDGPGSSPVRQFMRANVRSWIADYHFDGLRFDAVHAIVDRSPEHIVGELCRCGRASAPRRRLYMVAENEAQDVSILASDRRPDGVDGLWNEDWHHSAFVAITGRRQAYFTDYIGSAHEFAAMAQWNLLYQGQWYTWQKKRRGSDARRLPRSAFVCFLENHDQVANTGFGTRLHHLADESLRRAMTALLLLGPGVPMLFQGQERSVAARFTYFADHEAPLSQLVRSGREEFLAQFPNLRDPQARALIADPSDESAFRRCQIEWDDSDEGARTWQLHADLLTLRRTDTVLSRLGTRAVDVAGSAPTSTVLLLRYTAADDERLALFNLGQVTTLRMNDPLLAPPTGRTWVSAWCSESAVYGGGGTSAGFGDGPWTVQARCAWLLRAAPEETTSS